MTIVTRLGSANLYDRTINNISKQQAELASQMEHGSAGKRVMRASDDPVAAAQAERARTRLTRIDIDQRTLEAQTATVKYGESTLGEINTAVQEFRSLLVQAGNGSYNQTQRDTLVEQLQSLRNQILGYSNRQDSNGLPLFRGLDTQSSTPFPNGESGINAGQTNLGDYNITNSLNGAMAFFSGVTGNGIAAVDRDASSLGKSWANVGTVADPVAASALKGPPAITVSVSFDVDADGKTIYNIVGGDDDGKTGFYKSGDAIRVQGMDVTFTGDPLHTDPITGTKTYDSFTLSNSESQSLFETLDSAIASVRNAGNQDGTTQYGNLAHAMAKSQAEIDTQLNRISTVRGFAGDLLNQAERMGNTLLARTEQVESQRSNAEDIDLVKALSDLETQKTAVSTALQSYASIQKLSLFNYIN